MDSHGGLFGVQDFPSVVPGEQQGTTNTPKQKSGQEPRPKRPYHSTIRVKRDKEVLLEESRHRQKLLRMQMKELFIELAAELRPPLDPKEKTKTILQRSIEYIRYLHELLDNYQAIIMQFSPDITPPSFEYSSPVPYQEVLDPNPMPEMELFSALEDQLPPPTSAQGATQLQSCVRKQNEDSGWDECAAEGADDGLNDDLKKAIELSLQEERQRALEDQWMQQVFSNVTTTTTEETFEPRGGAEMRHMQQNNYRGYSAKSERFDEGTALTSGVSEDDQGCETPSASSYHERVQTRLADDMASLKIREGGIDEDEMDSEEEILDAVISLDEEDSADDLKQDG